jgi:putative FmdB family regulatory protein
MPTYEYHCSSCGKTFDVFHSITDNPVNKCPECGKSVKRLISGGSGFIMKGRSGSREMPSCAHTGCCADSGSCADAGSCGMHEHCH